MIGKTISHYKILQKLGGGGMGVVYKAEDTKLNRTVALKFLPPEMTRDATAKRRFLREAQAASALEHPNICNIHEIDIAPGGQMFIGMAFYEGVSLKQRVSSGPVPVQEAFEIGLSVCEGLASAHSQGIIHRDIKPGNVMITSEGYVKILDFGLAKLLGRSRVTQSNVTLGTVAYMSPEQANGEEVDGRTDIWSLGVMLYELLTGQLPFSAGVAQAVIYSVLNKDPVPVRELRSDVPRQFADIIAKCLKKDRSDRYQNVGDLAADLRAMALRLGWQSAGTVREVIRVGYGRRSRRRAQVAGAAVVVVAVVLLIAWWTRRPPPQSVVFTTDVRLAVMPLEAFEGERLGGEMSEVVAGGVSEWLTMIVDQMSSYHESMWVVAFHKTAPGQLYNPVDASGAFGVNTLLSGSLQRYGDGHRLSLYTQSAQTLRRTKSGAIDFQPGDELAVQDGVVDMVADMLDIRLAEDERSALSAGRTSHPSAFTACMQGLGYLQRSDRANNLERGIASLEAAVAADSFYVMARAALGMAYGRMYKKANDRGWLERALEAGETAVAIDSRAVYANTALGEVNLLAGNIEEAIAAYQIVLAADPKSTLARRRLADIYYQRQGRFDEAEIEFREGVRLKPDYFETHVLLGYYLKKSDRVDEAIEEFTRVLDLAPDDAWTLRTLGAIYSQREEWSRALELYRRSFSIRPGCVSCVNIGTLLYYRQRFEEAADYYRFALEYCDSTRSNHYLRWQDWAEALYWVEGRRDDAKEKFRRAIRLAEAQLDAKPDDPWLLADLASYYARVEDRRRALRLLERVLPIAGDDEFILFLIGCTYEKLDDRVRALHYVGEAIRHDYSLSRVSAEPLLRDLREDVRYKQMLGGGVVTSDAEGSAESLSD